LTGRRTDRRGTDPKPKGTGPGRARITREESMALWLQYVKAWVREETGQDLVEYALLLALIVLVAIATMGAVGDEIALIWEDIVSALQGATQTA